MKQYNQCYQSNIISSIFLFLRTENLLNCDPNAVLL